MLEICFTAKHRYVKFVCSCKIFNAYMLKHSSHEKFTFRPKIHGFLDQKMAEKYIVSFRTLKRGLVLTNVERLLWIILPLSYCPPSQRWIQPFFFFITMPFQQIIENAMADTIKSLEEKWSHQNPQLSSLIQWSCKNSFCWRCQRGLGSTAGKLLTLDCDKMDRALKNYCP